MEQELQQNQMVVVHIIGWPHVTITIRSLLAMAGTVVTCTPGGLAATICIAIRVQVSSRTTGVIPFAP